MTTATEIRTETETETVVQASVTTASDTPLPSTSLTSVKSSSTSTSTSTTESETTVWTMSISFFFFSWAARCARLVHSCFHFGMFCCTFMNLPSLYNCHVNRSANRIGSQRHRKQLARKPPQEPRQPLQRFRR